MKNKVKLNKLKKAYFKMPNKILDIGLDAQCVAIYSYMAKCPEDFDPAISVMAKSLNLSKPTIIKYIQKLKDRNIIRVIRPGGQNVITQYEFCSVEEWK